MKSVRQLKEVLGLNTIHQTRNRIKAVEEVIQPYVKRGENNEILVGEEGVAILKELQDLYESGLLLGEAADVVRSEYISEEDSKVSTDSYSSIEDLAKPEKKVDLTEYLLEELEFQRKLILNLSRGEEAEPQGNREREKGQWWAEWI